jgi:hypothetical protein
MDFDTAFDRLIGHEGGYVDDPTVVLQYVDASQKKSHSRNGAPALRGDVGSVSCAAPESRGHLYSTGEHEGLRMFGGRVQQARVLKGLLQRALHSGSEGASPRRSRSGKEARRSVLCVRWRNGRQGWVGDVPATLPTSEVHRPEGRRRNRVRGMLHGLWWHVSPGGFRLSPLRRQGGFAECNVCQPINRGCRQRVNEVQAALRELPSTGASQ